MTYKDLKPTEWIYKDYKIMTIKECDNKNCSVYRLGKLDKTKRAYVEICENNMEICIKAINENWR